MIQNNELENDIVTVSKLQIALHAIASLIQSELSGISLKADTETSEGLWHLLQAVVRSLVSNSQNWTHVLASSQTIASREEAQTIFDSFSMEERQKFSVETIANVDGAIAQQPAPPTSNQGPPAYIIVTLLIGTADDRPLFGDINSSPALKAALQRVASIRPDYLMIFELLWTPQAETDSLPEEEMLSEYADMIEIA